MKGLISLLIMAAAGSSAAYASQCTLDSISERDMRLANYWKSQAASSIRVRCDQAYNIRFSSLNMKGTNGESAVTNGPYSISTRMWIQGANRNEWNAMLSPASPGSENKYVVGVQLMERPSVNMPAGIYRDVVFISLSF